MCNLGDMGANVDVNIYLFILFLFLQNCQENTFRYFFGILFIVPLACPCPLTVVLE